MEAPKHTKPFNLEHARAGAPFSCEHGHPIQILAWDRKHPTHPIVGMETDGEQELVAFRVDGTADHGVGFITSRLVMLPLGYIDGKPVFVGDEIEMKCLAGAGSEWKHVKAQPGWAGTWNDDGTLARWPAPAKQYPVTQMDYLDLMSAAMKTNSSPMSITGSQVISMANAALRHAIDAGQVVTAADVAAVQGKLDKAEATLEQAGYTDNGGVLWKPPLGLSPDQRAEYKQASMELGKAERLLESLGYRSAGNGEWTAPGGRHAYEQPASGFRVEGDKESIDRVQDLMELFTLRERVKAYRQDIKLSAERDMAVAKEVVKSLCWVLEPHHPERFNDEYLLPVIARVQP